MKQLGPYFLHNYNQINQLGQYSKATKRLLPHQAVCVVDFAENYQCREFREAQNSYYTRNSMTVHPMVLILSEDSIVRRDAVDIY